MPTTTSSTAAATMDGDVEEVIVVEAAELRWMARGEHELPSDSSWLTARETQRAAEMKFTKRRNEYLLRRWVGKHAVAAATGASTGVRDLARIEVGNLASGAPHVLVDGQATGLEVSLTDRAGWAVCVVGYDLTRVGCDLEIAEVRSVGLVRDFLTEVEQDYVDAHLEGDARDAAANLIWSAKESALKVLRTGLRQNTRSVVVTVETAGVDGWGLLTITTAPGSTLHGWWRRAGAYLFTVCADRPIPPPAALPGSADLGEAAPTHSWVEEPVASTWPTEPAKPGRPDRPVN